MSQADPVRVLVAGDPYVPAGPFTRALAGLGTVAVTGLQPGTLRALPPRTDW